MSESRQSLYLICAFLFHSIEATKIGIAVNPQRRLGALQGGNHRALFLHKVWTPADLGEFNAEILEQCALRQLKTWRLRGEWFCLKPEFLERFVALLMNDNRAALRAHMDTAMEHSTISSFREAAE